MYNRTSGFSWKLPECLCFLQCPCMDLQKEMTMTLYMSKTYSCLILYYKYGSISHHISKINHYVHMKYNYIYRLYNYLAYRRFTRWIRHVFGGKWGKSIPACAVDKTRTTFPSESYVRFKYSRPWRECLNLDDLLFTSSILWNWS